MDEIISVFCSHKLLTTDDLKILQHFAQNEYLQMQFLFSHLQHLRVTIWLTICDALESVEAMKHIRNQLLNGKLLNSMYVYVASCYYGIAT